MENPSPWFEERIVALFSRARGRDVA